MLVSIYVYVCITAEAPSDDRKPTFFIPSGSHTSKMVLKGQVLEMECIAEGLWVRESSIAVCECLRYPSAWLSLFVSFHSPTPEISWTKVSGDFPATRTSFLHYKKMLRIVDVSESDAGDYRCTAVNQLGSVHHTIQVTVKGTCARKLRMLHLVFSFTLFVHLITDVHTDECVQ